MKVDESREWRVSLDLTGESGLAKNKILHSFLFSSSLLFHFRVVFAIVPCLFGEENKQHGSGRGVCCAYMQVPFSSALTGCMDTSQCAVPCKMDVRMKRGGEGEDREGMHAIRGEEERGGRRGGRVQCSKRSEGGSKGRKVGR